MFPLAKQRGRQLCLAFHIWVLLLVNETAKLLRTLWHLNTQPGKRKSLGISSVVEWKCCFLHRNTRHCNSVQDSLQNYVCRDGVTSWNHPSNPPVLWQIRYESIIATLCENLDSLDEPDARAAMIWIVGEYAERIDNADELLESFLEGFHDESTQVKLCCTSYL